MTFLEHFVSHSSFSKDKPIIILMDNHDTHMSISEVDLGGEKGIIILTVPPHCVVINNSHVTVQYLLHLSAIAMLLAQDGC